MTRKIYTFLFGVVCIIFFTNNATGPVNVQQTGYTGAPGDAGTCSSCHSSGSYNPTAKLEVFDSLGSTAVTQYTPGKVYTIRLTISATSGTPSGYGFQMIDLLKSNNTNVKGFLPKASQAANISINTIASSGRVYAEQGARLSSNIIAVKWKAPSTNVGTVVFYAAGNAANSNFSDAGDSGTPSVSIEFPAGLAAGTNELAENVRFQLSPNPTPSIANIELESKVSRTLTLKVLDLSGRAVVADKWNVQTGDNQKAVDLKDLPKGAYMIQLFDNQNIISKKIIKL